MRMVERDMTDVRGSAQQPAVRLEDGSDDRIGTPLGLAALLAGTLVGTVSNNVVNVPLGAIIDEFDAPLGNGVFVVVGFLVCFAATIPLAGWFGDRFGRRRIYCAALLATAVCAVGAATAPSLPSGMALSATAVGSPRCMSSGGKGRMSHRAHKAPDGIRLQCKSCQTLPIFLATATRRSLSLATNAAKASES